VTTEFFFDVETFSETPIQHGTHAYKIGAEMIACSYAEGVSGTAYGVDLTNDFGIGNQPLPAIVLEAINDPGVTIIGQNFGNFDRNLLAECYDIVLPPERIHDTMVQAMSHGLPGGLDTLGEIFNVSAEDAKNKEGKSLIQLFCKPRPKNMALRRATKRTHPVEWAKFVDDYAKSDITAMQHIYKSMPKWNYPGTGRGNRRSFEFDLWCLDQKINDRGFMVDRELAAAAVTAVRKSQAILNRRTDEMTAGDVEKASQRDRLLKHLLEQWGVDLPDMTKGTLERRVHDENLPDAVRELIAIRLEVSATSISKYNRLLNSVSEDGRLRGTMQFCGASRTGRWAGRIFQPQNLPRPDIKPDEVELGIKAIKGGVSHLLYDNVTKLASNALRGSIIAGEGNKLVAVDLSNIEGRVLAWLAGEKWKLQAFRDYDAGTGHDLYHITAGGILGKDPGDVTKDERQEAGKVPELACGYQGAIGAFQSMAALYGLELEDDRVWEIVSGWRTKNAAIVSFWNDVNEAAWECIVSGTTKRAGKIQFEREKAWLKMRLPSGRYLCYADPKIIPDPRYKGRMTIGYMGLNSYTRRFERLTTYGGKLVENATQAVARDVLAEGMMLCEDDGYAIVLDVHDEIIAEVVDNDNYSVKGMSSRMCRIPEWADDDLPLSAGGFEAYRYKKE
jgi:DNA polymerase